MTNLLDTSVELLPSHLVLEKLPSESGLVVNVRDLLDGLIRLGGLGSKLLGDGLSGVLELLKKGRGNGEEVNTGKGLDLSDVSETEEKATQGRKI